MLKKPILSLFEERSSEEKVFFIIKTLDRKISNDELSWSLQDGGISAALLMFEAGLVYGIDELINLSREYAVFYVKKSLKDKINLSFNVGQPGVLWAAKIILGNDKFLDDLLPDNFRDKILESMALRLEYQGLYELVNGASGWFIFSETVPKSTWFRSLIKKYFNLTKGIDGAHFWPLPPGVTRHQLPPGQIGFGIAHGILGPIILRKNKKDILELYQLVKNIWPIPLPSIYPLQLADPLPVRSAWCYGDACTAFALSTLAQEMNLSEIQHESNLIFVKAVGVSKSYLRIKDEGICHGMSGNALMCINHYLKIGDEKSRRQAQVWAQKILSIKTDVLIKHPANGLHGGLSGIGLVLLSSYAKKQTTWDRALLLS
jgi:hypothetical protein